LIAYHRCYIPKFSELTRPLTDLTYVKYSKLLPWLPEHEKSFCDLKEALSSLCALTVPRFGGVIVLRTGASGSAISGCLYQRKDDVLDNVHVSVTGEFPICFFSQKLSSTQMAWSVVDREAYADIASLHKFHHLAFGSEIVVFSDHSPLSFLDDCATNQASLLVGV